MGQPPTRTNAKAPKKAAKRSFGEIAALPSGRFRARYTGPDAARHKAPRTFATRMDAEGWLSAERRLIDLEAWSPPAARSTEAEAEKITVGQWITRYLELRAPSLRASTMQGYTNTANGRILNVEGAAGKLAVIPLVKLSARDAHAWWDAVCMQWPETRTANRNAHVLLRAACAAAVERELIPANPVAVRAAKAKPKPKPKTLPTAEELHAIIGKLPERYRLAGALVLFHGLRVGEMLALRRENIIITGSGDGVRATVQVRANFQRVKGTDGHYRMVRQPPKSAAGRRDVPFLAEWLPVLRAHLEDMDDQAPGALVTATRTGAAVMDTSWRSVFGRAREAAGVRPDLTSHYGRNYLITRLAEAGATPKEIGAILGQEDVSTIVGVYMKVRAERPADLMGRISTA